MGYGHEPWRAAWFLVWIVLVAWGAFTAAAGSEQIVPVAEPHNTEALERATGNKGVHADKCVFEIAYPCFHGIWYALDTAVPFVDLRRQSYWVPVGAYRWVMWGVIVAGWLLVSASRLASRSSSENDPGNKWSREQETRLGVLFRDGSDKSGGFASGSL